MKTIYLVRHAEAVSVQKNIPDDFRPLTKKGSKSAVSMAKKMKKSGMKADHWISSTANRAVETAHLFAEVMGRSIHKIQLKEAFYSADRPEALADILKGLKNKHQSAIMFGHNPMLSDLAAYFVKHFHDSLPKIGLAVIEFNVDKWAEISEGTGRLAWVDYPERDSKLVDRMRKDLKNHIQMELTGVLARLDEPAAEKSKKLIKTVSKTLADSFIKTIRKQRTKEMGKLRLEDALIEHPPQVKKPEEPSRAPAPVPPPAAAPSKPAPKPDSPVKTKPAPKTTIVAKPKPKAKELEKKTTSKRPPTPRPKTSPAAKKPPQKKTYEKPAVEAAAVDPAVTAEPAAQTPPKRRPGRPKKSPADKVTKAAAGGTAAKKPAAGRKPARSKKQTPTSEAEKAPAVETAAVDPAITAEPAAQTPPKRKPGRPKKSPADKVTKAAVVKKTKIQSQGS